MPIVGESDGHKTFYVIPRRLISYMTPVEAEHVRHANLVTVRASEVNPIGQFLHGDQHWLIDGVQERDAFVNKDFKNVLKQMWSGGVLTDDQCSLLREIEARCYEREHLDLSAREASKRREKDLAIERKNAEKSAREREAHKQEQSRKEAEAERLRLEREEVERRATEELRERQKREEFEECRAEMDSLVQAYRQLLIAFETGQILERRVVEDRKSHLSSLAAALRERAVVLGENLEIPALLASGDFGEDTVTLTPPSEGPEEYRSAFLAGEIDEAEYRRRSTRP